SRPTRHALCLRVEAGAPRMTAPAFDFAPLSDAALGWIGEDDCPFFVNHKEQLEWLDQRLDDVAGKRPHGAVANMARELLTSRAALRALVEAQDVIKRAERDGVTDIPAFVRDVERLDGE